MFKNRCKTHTPRLGILWNCWEVNENHCYCKHSAWLFDSTQAQLVLTCQICSWIVVPEGYQAWDSGDCGARMLSGVALRGLWRQKVIRRGNAGMVVPEYYQAWDFRDCGTKMRSGVGLCGFRCPNAIRRATPWIRVSECYQAWDSMDPGVKMILSAGLHGFLVSECYQAWDSVDSGVKM